jgi:hypothetical protein
LHVPLQLLPSPVQVPLGSCPAGTAEQMPRLPVTLQLMEQSLEHTLPQHTPASQCPFWH